MMKRLAQAEKNLGNVEFVIGQASNAEQTAQLLEQGRSGCPRAGGQRRHLWAEQLQ